MIRIRRKNKTNKNKNNKKKKRKKIEEEIEEGEGEGEGQEAPYNRLTPDHPPLAALTGNMFFPEGCASRTPCHAERDLIN